MPVATVPKLTLAGVADTAPVAVAGFTPVPLTGYRTLPVVKLPVNEMYPENRPVLVGANLTDKTIDVPPEIVRGTVNPLKLKPVACIDFPEIVTATLPVFFIVTESV